MVNLSKLPWNTVTESPRAHRRHFCFSIFRDRTQVGESVGPFPNAADAKRAAMAAAASMGADRFRVCYWMGFHPWRIERDGTWITDPDFLYGHNEGATDDLAAPSPR